MEMFSRFPHVEVVGSGVCLPFKNDIFEEIYMYGVFEHFSFDDSIKVLTECYRCLVLNGVLDLNVPDFDILVDIYAKRIYDNLIPGVKEDTSWSVKRNWVMHSIFGWQEHEYDLHRWGWNEETLRERLEGANFKNIDMYSKDAYEKETHVCFKAYKLG
jgi:predicted SAM-dependent methyltransferase